MAQGTLLEADRLRVSPPDFSQWHEVLSIPSYWDKMHRYRTYGTVLTGVEKAVHEGDRLGFWEPGRLVEGVMNFKIKHPETVDDTVELIDRAMRVATGIHSGSVAAEDLEFLGEKVKVWPALRRSHIRDHRGGSDVVASNPERSGTTARRLREVTGDSDLLMVVLGNTGIAAGINTFLAYTEQANTSDSAIYPVRFSTHKHKDDAPQVDSQEADHLKELSTGTDQVVIFDENCASGHTLRRASDFFTELLDTEVIPVANADRGGQLESVIGTAALEEIQKRPYNTC